jgi:hypothetical protein
MGKYSDDAAVDAAIGAWVREEEQPAAPHAPALALAPLKRAIEALDPDARVHETVHATFEHCALRLAVKATKLAPGLLYAELGVHLSRSGPLAHVAWEWRRSKDEAEPSRGELPPGATDRARALDAGVRDLLRKAGETLVPLAEARREVRVADDPLYEGAYYDITVFEVLFGMGYPERQR